MVCIQQAEVKPKELKFLLYLGDKIHILNCLNLRVWPPYILDIFQCLQGSTRSLCMVCNHLQWDHLEV